MAKNERKNQRERVLEWLQKHGTLSDVEAREELAVHRAGARVFELRRLGFNIVTKMESSKNRFGEPVRYGVYYLKEGDAE